ncbi:extracellular solute-binding protein [Embleya sp. NBC_00888]|uniref:extracellular solute-binding protein n=1 Tax=Embleya sp. NBC_00888 TaxID=2975960 RepID=UPI00386C6D4A|nr:extracellular solute-binding protein [Embleya sp. NBC_00888]
MLRRRGLWAVALALVASVVGCGGGSSGPPVLNWYVPPDNGAYQKLADRCSQASGGAYRVKVSVLPTDASGQREQLVRRLAAKDSSIDVMALDPVFVPEFAEAGFLRPFDPAEAAALTEGMLSSAVESSGWRNRLVAAPFRANTQLLWYRKSVAAAAGLDLSRPVSWDEVITAAEKTRKTVSVPAKRYEGITVWVNGLVTGAGGAIVRDVEKGVDLKPTLQEGGSGKRAAEVMRRLGRSSAAPANLATSIEDDTRTTFQSGSGGFMVNWTYARGAAAEAVDDGQLAREVLDDYGWARYPQTDAGKASKPPFGGIALGVSKYGKHSAAAVSAVRCAGTLENQITYMLESKETTAKAAAYDDPRVRQALPMADLIRESLDQAGPRPRTPYYNDVSASVQRMYHPPADVDPNTAPRRTDDLITGVLHDKVLL